MGKLLKAALFLLTIGFGAIGISFLILLVTLMPVIFYIFSIGGGILVLIGIIGYLINCIADVFKE